MIQIDLPPWFIFTGLFVLGAIVGSFLNVCILRIPQREQFWASLQGLWDRPSHCPRCKADIRWHDNVPILGWLMLRGRCRNCRMRISPRYPFIELLNAVLFVVVFWFEVPIGWSELTTSCLYTELGPQAIPGLGPLSPTAFVLLRYAYHMVLIEALLVASFIDFDLRIIPDGVTLPAMAVGVVASTVIGRVHLVPAWFQSPALLTDFRIVLPEALHPLLTAPAVPAWFSQHPHLHGLLVSLAGLVVGGGIVWTVRIIGHWILGREAMGFGDVILMAMIGSFLGWQATVVAFFLAPACALAVVSVSWIFRRDRYIPYGPYLSLGALLVLLGWQTIWPSAGRIFSLGPMLLAVFAVMLALFVANLALVQIVKRLLGIDSEPDEPVAEWTAADQNQYFAGELVDRHSGRWKTQHDWPGIAAGRGTLQQERWRG